MRKEISTSNYDFQDQIREGLFYADKTDFMHKLATTPKGCFFLSRPRRFGKSLMISTLKYIFKGRRDLFEGLKIDSMSYDWKEYPVLHLNMAELESASVADFRQSIRSMLKSVAKRLDLSVDLDQGIGMLFKEILEEAAAHSATEKVVLLIDEYDAPLISNIGKPHLEEIREIVDNFYVQIKNANSILRFTMITGVTRFSKVSIFSKLNHLKDLTIHPDFATMLGYTQEEVEHFFGERISELAQRKGVDFVEYLSHIRQKYNGFRFVPEANTLYNPVSIGLFLEHGLFENYWFDTGSPTFLIDLLKQKEADFFEMLDEEVSMITLSSFDVARMEAKALLFQTGYLTIASSKMDGDHCRLRLDFPNREVEESFDTFLVAGLGVDNTDRVTNDAFQLRDCMREGNTSRFVRLLHAHLAAIPYESKPMTEACFKSILFSLFRLVGLYCIVEQHTNKGRIDTVIESDEHIYVIEYKYNLSGEEAMAQIKAKGYYESFREKGKVIHLLALNYDLKQRNIGEDWLVEIV